jgi:hypothetical protein
MNDGDEDNGKSTRGQYDWVILVLPSIALIAGMGARKPGMMWEARNDPLLGFGTSGVLELVIVCSALWAYRKGRREGRHDIDLLGFTLGTTVLVSAAQCLVISFVDFAGCGCISRSGVS